MVLQTMVLLFAKQYQKETKVSYFIESYFHSKLKENKHSKYSYNKRLVNSTKYEKYKQTKRRAISYMNKNHKANITRNSSKKKIPDK